MHTNFNMRAGSTHIYKIFGNNVKPASNNKGVVPGVRVSSGDLVEVEAPLGTAPSRWERLPAVGNGSRPLGTAPDRWERLPADRAGR